MLVAYRHGSKEEIFGFLIREYGFLSCIGRWVCATTVEARRLPGFLGRGDGLWEVGTVRII